jgi:hypothetical protein
LVEVLTLPCNVTVFFLQTVVTGRDLNMVVMPSLEVVEGNFLTHRGNRVILYHVMTVFVESLQ